ncbi:MAG: hypothetical protein R3325_07260 [Thermoanaerobaculia bacterium]|nr:hypothetical protein [Thermoanaerobaculia bacterium]
MRPPTPFPGGGFVVLSLLLICLVPRPAAAQPPAVSEHVEVRAVTIPLTVTDAEGRPIAGLERDQIELLRDGEPVEVVALSPVAQPAPDPAGTSSRVFVLYLDTAFLDAAEATALLPPLSRFLEEELPPATRLYGLVADRASVRPLHPPTAARAEAVAALAEVTATPVPALLAEAREIERDIERALGGRGRRVMTVRDAIPDQLLERISALAQEVAAEVEAGGRRLQWALQTVAGLPGSVDLLYVGGEPPVDLGATLHRRWLVALGPDSYYVAAGSADGDGAGLGTGRGEEGFSTGATSFSALAAPGRALDTAAVLEPLVTRALLDGVRVHTLTVASAGAGGGGVRSASGGAVGPAGTATGPALTAGSGGGAGAELLRSLARSTSGAALHSRGGVAEGLTSLATRLSGGYRLTFLDASAEPGTRHRLQARLPGAGSHVRLEHPEGYVALSLDQIAARAALSALRLGLEDNPLEVEVRAAVGGAADQPVLELAIEVPLARLALATERRAHTGSISVFAATGGWESSSEVRKAVVPLRIAHQDLLIALGRRVEYGFPLPRPAGGDRLAVAVRDDLALVTSTVVVPLPPAANARSGGP